MHDAIAVGLPLLAIFAGILFNRSDIRELRKEIAALGNEVRTEIAVLRSEMYGRFDKVAKQLDGIKGDLRQFYRLTASWRPMWKR